MHRHVHESLPTVFAYSSELDAWLANRQVSPEQVSSPEVPSSRRRMWALAGAALLVTVALVTGASQYFDRSLTLQEHDWVLLEAFENLSGEAVLDGALRNALERELSNSRFLFVTPRERVADTLRLMRKPPDAKLDLALAREVCLRDGGIRALITGRTEKLGSAYVFSVSLIDPAQNRPVAAYSETAPGRDEIAPAIRRLSNWVRESLGEAMNQIEISNRELEKVTTPSLPAWQLFTAANNATRRWQWAISAELNRQALIADPDFASAHLWLAWALFNLRDEEWKAEAQRALDLSPTVTERERLFIVASNHRMKRQPDQAIPVLEALVRMHPDFYYGYFNLATAYRTVGREREAADVEARAADLRPNDYQSNAKAGVNLLPFDLENASRYAQRARDLADPDRMESLDIQVKFSKFNELWVREDMRGALAELRRLERLPIPQELARYMGASYLLLGRLRDAGGWMAKDSPTSPGHAYGMLQLAMFSGDDAQIRQAIEEALRANEGGAGTAVLCGLYDIADCAPAGWAAGVGPNDIRRGVLALQERRDADAVSFFQRSFDQWLPDRPPMTEPAAGLSAAYERTGELQKALEPLERIPPSVWRSGLPNTGLRWLENQSRLAALYRRLGHDQDARQIEGQLRKLLAFADPDHPILRQISQYR